MKSRKIIIFLICAVMSVCFLSGCSPKIPTTKEVFTTTMEADGFTVIDATAETETNGLATDIIVATKGADECKIEFWKLTDIETGEAVFYSYENKLDSEHSVKSMMTELTFGNYNYYAFTSDGKFHMIARIDDTILFSAVNKEYKNEVLDVAKKLGYK